MKEPLEWRMNNIACFLKGQSLELYYELLINCDTWEEIKTTLLNTYQVVKPDYFSEFINLKFNQEDNINEFYQRKLTLSSLAKLNSQQTLAGLNDCLPILYKRDIILSNPQTPSQWLEIVSKIQTLNLQLKNLKCENAQPNNTAKTQIFRDNNKCQGSPFQDASQYNRTTSVKSPLNRQFPPNPCKFCLSRGKRLYHWNQDCRMPYMNTPTQGAFYGPTARTIHTNMAILNGHSQQDPPITQHEENHCPTCHSTEEINPSIPI
jgi:hypothetical protein